MHREPEVLVAEAQLGEWLDCRARIMSKELAPIHSVKKGILQNACSTSPNMDADLGKSALMRTARLMKSLAKGFKKNGYKSDLRNMGACLHQILNLRKENMLSTPERRCT